ncbi:hypothetical protein HRbin40_02298 [bacterium HR40]|nr:hypothetical protein HRbin40_02298 [bacterium HR40]
MRWLLYALALFLSAPTEAAAAPLGVEAALQKSQAVLGRSLPDLAFSDVSGRRVRFADFSGRPFLLTLVYTACSDVCPLVVRNLHPIVENAQELFGADRFAVLTIGFDARHDTPDRMRAFMRSQGVSLPNWHFLSADQKTIDRLAEAVGFTFYPAAGGFEHMAQITVVDANGRIYRQIYGGAFAPPQIVEPLKDVVFGRFRPLADVESLIDKVRLFCTVYDPASGRYYFDYSLFMAIASGAFSLALVATLLVREWRRSVKLGSREPSR